MIPLLLIAPLGWAVIGILLMHYLDQDVHSAALGSLFVVMFLLGLGMILFKL